MTYHIKVRFRVDSSGLVTRAQITEGSGNSALGCRRVAGPQEA